MSVTETELKNKAVAPRITIAALEENIVSESYINAGKAAESAGQPTVEAMHLLTICVLGLKNGFTVTGQSACADPNNFDESIGCRLAKSDAMNKIWPLMGYELRTKLAQVEKAFPLEGKALEMGAKTYIGSKVVYAAPMNRLDYNILRGWELPADKNGADEGYLVQYADQNQTNVEGFTGYVRWSPKAVFEQAYKEI